MSNVHLDQLPSRTLPVAAAAHERLTRLRGYLTGAVDFLFKPIEAFVLRNKTETFFELYRQNEELGRQLEIAREQQECMRAHLAEVEVQSIQLRRQNEDMLRACEAAEAVNHAKDEFLANVSHEIRTPMNAILGMTELVLDTPLTEGQRHSLRTARSAAGGLLGIINELLDFSKIEAGKLALDPTEFVVRDMLAETLGALAVCAHDKGLELVCRVGPEVPARVVGDAVRLRQIITNLVGNAIKFTDDGEIVIHVDIATGTAPEADHRLRFSIRDTGIGIARDKQEKIFGAFEQEDTSTTRRYGGTGLGLTISGRLVALMGGRLSVASDLGAGATFTFTARYDRAAAEAPSVPEPAGCAGMRVLAEGGDAAPQSGRAPSLRVLVAEDNDFNALLMQELLARRGHDVQLARTGREALRHVEEGGYDLILLDVHMPELDGFAVIRAIRERERGSGGHLPVIAVTARSRREDRERCIAAGMDDYLAKPIGASDLWAAINRVTAESPAIADDLTAC